MFLFVKNYKVGTNTKKINLLKLRWRICFLISIYFCGLIKSFKTKYKAIAIPDSDNIIVKTGVEFL
jgi:hypothetical protein